ncbi:MAG: hypothetical protein WA432_04395 [Candidatus Babeliaceae bacterium]
MNKRFFILCIGLILGQRLIAKSGFFEEEPVLLRQAYGAMHLNDLDQLKYILRAPRDWSINDIDPVEQKTLIHKAIASSKIPFIIELMKWNPDLTVPDKKTGETPFETALSKGNQTIIDLISPQTKIIPGR